MNKKTYKELIKEWPVAKDDKGNEVEYTEGSPDTSINQVAAGFKKIDWKGVKANFDVGGGKYDKGSNWLMDNHGVKNYIYDPYNRSSKYNKESLAKAKKEATVSTIFNVINVQENEKKMIELVKSAKLPKTKHIYIIAYIKDPKNKGKAKPSKRGYQANRSMDDYLRIVKKVYPQAKLKKGMSIIDF
jgi:hypothetical protein